MQRIITTILCMITGVICHAEKLKVACVGDSITYGSCIEDRENYSYPAVPVEENTAVFEKLVAGYGHEMMVIHKPDVGHHPHSLYNPEPIVDFILNATGQKGSK